AYHGAAKDLVTAWKQRGLRGLATAAADVIANTVERPDIELLAFVPPDGDRSVKRGHPPAERLAYELDRRWDLPVANALGRARTVRPQPGLHLAERRRDVAGGVVAPR